MARLGDFGTVRAATDHTFGWFGITIRVNPDLSDVALIDLLGAVVAMSGADGKEPDDAAMMEAIQAVAGLATALVHPDDFAEFWRLTRANRQTIEDVSKLAVELMGGLAGRPTQLPSASSDGQPNTHTSSTDASSSPALRLLEGRPDLQVAVLRAEEARQAG